MGFMQAICYFRLSLVIFHNGTGLVYPKLVQRAIYHESPVPWASTTFDIQEQWAECMKDD
jgi:hypothetical protein